LFETDFVLNIVFSDFQLFENCIEGQFSYKQEQNVIEELDRTNIRKISQ